MCPPEVGRLLMNQISIRAAAWAVAVWCSTFASAATKRMARHNDEFKINAGRTLACPNLVKCAIPQWALSGRRLDSDLHTFAANRFSSASIRSWSFRNIRDARPCLAKSQRHFGWQNRAFSCFGLKLFPQFTQVRGRRFSHSGLTPLNRPPVLPGFATTRNGGNVRATHLRNAWHVLQNRL